MLAADLKNPAAAARVTALRAELRRSKDEAAEAPVEVPMDLRWMKPAIEVNLNGTGPYWFILDSGAGPYLIGDADLAAELEFPLEGKESIGDPTHPHALGVNKVFVDRVEVGSLVYEGVEALTWDKVLYSGSNRPRGIGLFGGRLVTFDYPAGKVRLERGDLPEPEGGMRLGGLRIENPVLNRVVTIDKRNQRVRLVSDGRAIASSNRPRLGLVSTVVQDGRIPVTRLTPGSPAVKAGLRDGNELEVEVNMEPEPR
mgnify:CR=1 FL=1